MNTEEKTHVSRMSPLKFNLMMMLCVVVWAFAFSFIKLALNELSFVNLTIMRFLIVSIVLIPIILAKSKKFTKLHKKDVVPIFLLGFFGVIAYHFGLNYGEQYISSGAASLIIATIPVFIVILAVIFLKETITLKQISGIILALCGVIVISIWGKQDIKFEIEYFYAALAVLLASVLAAVYTIVGKKLLVRYSALSLTVYAMLLGSLGLIPFINTSLLHEITSMSLNTWIAVIFLGVFSTVIGYLIWYSALEIKNASGLGVYLYGIPVISTIIGYFFLGEGITFLFIFGGVLVIVGLAIVNQRDNKKSVT